MSKEWPKRKDGTPYPPASQRTPNKKAAKRLAARIKAYEEGMAKLNPQERAAYTKPGSYKK